MPRPIASRRRQRFPLTPLVDVIFLLLVFFMLSSRLAPYSLVPVDASPTDADTGAPAASATATADLLISVDAGMIRINGEAVERERALPRLATEHERGARSAIVMTRAAATVQDVVTVLDGLRRAGFEDVAVQGPRGGRVP